MQICRVSKSCKFPLPTPQLPLLRLCFVCACASQWEALSAGWRIDFGRRDFCAFGGLICQAPSPAEILRDGRQVERGAGSLGIMRQTLFCGWFSHTLGRMLHFSAFTPQKALSPPPPTSTVPSGSSAGGKQRVKKVVGWPGGKGKAPGARHVPDRGAHT